MRAVSVPKLGRDLVEKTGTLPVTPWLKRQQHNNNKQGITDNPTNEDFTISVLLNSCVFDEGHFSCILN